MARAVTSQRLLLKSCKQTQFLCKLLQDSNSVIMATVRGSSKKLKTMLKKIERDINFAQEKCSHMTILVEEAKKSCAKAIDVNTLESVRQTNNSEKLKYEKNWKLKVLERDYFSKKRIKYMEEEIQILKETVNKEHGFVPPREAARGVRDYFIDFMRSGFGLAVSAGMLGGLMATVMPHILLNL